MGTNERRKSAPLNEASFHLRSRRFLLKPSCYLEDIYYGCIIGLIHCVLVFFVNNVVPEPYMDEIFHFRQYRRYCEGDHRWDPMITTPPALYILALPLCSGPRERYINSIFIALMFMGFCRFRRLFTRSTIKMTSLIVTVLPVLLHTSTLFYTDALSLCSVIWAFTLPTPNAALLFALSCCTRQTNIIWAGLYAVVRMYHHFDDARPIRSFFTSVLRLWPFVALAGLFMSFVYINGGIVLGDASAHQPKPHFAQLMYLLFFFAMHSWPQALPLASELVSSLFSTTYFVVCVIFAVIIRYFTYDHPYLLADNRHVPFYLWRWWLHDGARRMVLVPVYAAAAIFVARMSSSIPSTVRVLFCLASAAVVVPAHLIEPRYFIIPFVLWRLSANSTPIKCINVLEVLYNIVVFSVVFILFLAKPFQWVHEPGVLQRFMW